MGLNTTRRGAVRGNLKSKLVITRFLSVKVSIEGPVCISVDKRQTLDVLLLQHQTEETHQTTGQILRERERGREREQVRIFSHSFVISDSPNNLLADESDFTLKRKRVNF